MMFQGNLSEARGYYEDALKIQEVLLGRFDYGFAVTLGNLGILLCQQV